MKKFIFTLALALAGVVNAFALSNSAIRENARFLSDRMAYELQMSPNQYEDCYEINYDFIDAIDAIMDEVVYGYQDAIDRYYDFLDWRNDDLRMIMTAAQFSRFCALEYFYRPIYTVGNNWHFRVRQRYSNYSYFYYDMPHVYHSYHGAHSRHHHSHGFYGGRYNHGMAHHYDSFRHHNGYHDIHHHDFGHQRHDRPINHRGHERPMNHHNGGPAHHHNEPAHRPDNHHHDRPSGNHGYNHGSSSERHDRPQHRDGGNRSETHRDNNRGNQNHGNANRGDRGGRSESRGHDNGTRGGGPGNHRR